MIELDSSVHPELVPLSWLIGSWEGVGVVGYADTPEKQFGQRVDFVAHPGTPFLQYTAHAWLLSEDGELESTLTLETGIWQLIRPRDAGDVGPGMLVPTEEPSFTSAAAVETLRTNDEGFEIEAEIAHPHGVMELYAGHVKGPRIDLSTDVVARTKTAKEYTASTRMYGLVGGELMWAWDMAALGHELATHSSARLKKLA
ncbi:FABP family protein [Brevibacterium sandarakinum]|uniref:FABP family protein n=1 Tax=Brevibacterium sandarakinum TaxID=629680 RepID=UPI002651671C|nr:FABP family protein [Brevibacterium sandarakinum]MDN5635961.1 FABP family protein [Brevibacterium sp.]MDN5657407.1 FABP family protein [Brevibacterium sandarakinum]